MSWVPTFLLLQQTARGISQSGYEGNIQKSRETIRINRTAAVRDKELLAARRGMDDYLDQRSLSRFIKRLPLDHFVQHYRKEMGLV